MRGFLVVDKPEGVSSHHVVAMMRALLGKVKIGHTGTLDPFATGVLVLAFGSYTRLISFLPEETKNYVATLRLGEKTSTGDTEGDVVHREKVPKLSKDTINCILKEMEGEQEQFPPQFSAIKVNGKPLYSYARKGQVIEVAPRKIHVHHLSCNNIEADDLVFDSIVSRGTYVRQLGEDIAERLGTVGHLTQLRRIKSGVFDIQEALSFRDISLLVTGLSNWKDTLSREGKQKYARCSSMELWTQLVPHVKTVEEVFYAKPQVHVSFERSTKIKNGLPPLHIPVEIEPNTEFWFVHDAEFIALATHDGEKIALQRVLN